MKTGLVLEGGALRGMYTAGVLDVWMDEGIQVDALFGVSAGALFGANLLSGQRGRAIRYNLRFLRDKRYMSLYSLLTTGNFVGKQFAYYDVTTKYDPYDEEAFEKNGAAFYTAVTNVRTGKAEMMQIRNVVSDMEILRATAALPFVSQMVSIDGEKYVDGGVADSIPVRACLERGFDRVVVILTRPMDYRKKPMNHAMIRARYGCYGALCEAMETRHARYNAQVEDVLKLEEEGKIFVIRPDSALQIARMERNPSKLQAVYDQGIADGKKTLAALRTYLGDSFEAGR